MKTIFKDGVIELHAETELEINGLAQFVNQAHWCQSAPVKVCGISIGRVEFNQAEIRRTSTGVKVLVPSV